MGVILAIDYGQVRSGLAISDQNKTFAFGLNTVSSVDLIKHIRQQVSVQDIEALVIGESRSNDGRQSSVEIYIIKVIKRLNIEFPRIPILRHDERFTSIIAKKSMLEMRLKKKQRQSKVLVDKMSAVLILQSYLDTI